MEDKFTAREVARFRRELLKRSDLDWLQTAEVIRLFIAQHGYGISRETALDAARRIDEADCNVNALHRELETLALVKVDST